MKKIITKFVQFPFYANIIIFVLLAGGIGSYMALKKSFFPERQSKFITVNVMYRGASPKEMEEGVTTRIEESIRGLVGIKEVRSTSREDMATVNIETTGKYDIDIMLTEIKNAVDGITSWPAGAEKPVVYKQRTSTMALNMSISGDVDLLTLKRISDKVEQDFMTSGLISQIQIAGFPDLEISVEVKEEALMRYRLTFEQLAGVIAQNNSDISAGMLKSDHEEILIRSRRRSVEPNKIGDIIIQANPDGSYLRIRDVADVKLKFADVATGFKMNGNNAIFYQISKLIEEDLEKISNYVNDYAEKFNEDHKNIKIDITYDFLHMLGMRLKMLEENGLFGIVLVLVSLALFLSFRLSFWVAWGIPASFLAMIMLANLVGITINMISLFGMILVIGILVDDGIVIGENIFSHFEKGKSPSRAAIDGTLEVMPAVMTSVSTTIVAFAPLFIVTGHMEFMHDMAFVVVVSLGFSLLEAFFVLPAHLGSKKVLKIPNGNGNSNRFSLRKKLEKFVDFLRFRFYGKLLKKLIKLRWAVVTLPIAFLMLTMGMFNGGIIEATIFPTMTFDLFNIDLAFVPGTGEKKTQEYLDKFEDIVWEVNEEYKEEYPDEEDFISYTGVTLGMAFNGAETGAHAGSIMIILRDMEEAPVSGFDVEKRITERIGKVPEAEKFSIGPFNRWGSPVSFSLLSNDLETLDKAKVEVMTAMKKIPALKNVKDNNAIGKQEIQINLKPKAYFLGLNHAMISNQVRQGFYGGQAMRLQSGKNEIRIWVRYPADDRETLGQLEKMKIKTAMGEYPLEELIDYEIVRGPVNIQRYNSLREVTIESDLVDPFAPVPPIQQFIQDNILSKIKEKYPSIEVVAQGQAKGGSDSINDMMILFPIAFAIIILIIIIHFRSVGQASLILMMIPVGLLGACWGHGIHGIPVSMLSAWGMVALTGVIINDAVVFLSKYNSLLINGQSVFDAAYNAGVARFRAIILTSLTTTLGLFPLIFEPSKQAQFLVPMAATLAYGVMIGTGFILITFPSLILVFNDIKYLIKRFISGDKNLKREDVEVAVLNSRRTID